MNRRRIPKSSKQIFDSLVANAIEFLHTSAEDLTQKPKYSIINFCAAMELFIKARLMFEHWSLIVTKPDDAVLTRFHAGSFQSVTMDLAILRLTQVAGETFSKDELNCFKTVREHRNRLMHFFHEAYSKPVSGKFLGEIVAEQCKAWFYLHRMLVGRWKRQFRKHQSSIEKINTKMKQHHTFLKTKFRELQPIISAEIGRGTVYEKCDSCGCDASRISIVLGPAFETKCLVCDRRYPFVQVTCPKCSNRVKVFEPCDGVCENKSCKQSIDLDYLLSHFGSGDSEDALYCGYCRFPEPSVVSIEKQHLCLFCAEVHKTMETVLHEDQISGKLD